MSEEYIHITRTGEEIPISQMETGHLCAQIALIQRLAKEGVTQFVTTPLVWGDDFYLDEFTLHGEQVYQMMDYDEYVAEWKKRVRLVSEIPIPIPR